MKKLVLLLLAAGFAHQAHAQSRSPDERQLTGLAVRPVPPSPATGGQDVARLKAEIDTLLAASGGSPEWLIAHPREAGRLQALRTQLYPPQPPQPLDYVREIEIPAEASATEEDFLVARAEAWNAFVQTHNRTLTASAVERERAFESLSTRQAPQLERLQALAMAVGREPKPQPPMPAPVEPPRDASPALRAFLAERNALVSAMSQQQNATDFEDLARRPAIRDRLNALQQRARALSAENPPLPTPATP